MATEENAVARSTEESALAALLAGVSVGTLVLQLERLGFPNTFMAGVVPLTPQRRFVGRARTLRCVPVRPDLLAERRQNRQADPHRRAIEEIGPGEVLVIDARGNRQAAVMGDLLAARVQAAGGVAVVTDGCVRDTPEIAQLGLPVYAAGAHAGIFGTQHLAADINVPIGCGGVLVMPGDLLVGDAEGVVVIPAARAWEVAERAAAQEAQDAFLREKIRQGVPLARAYPPDEALLAEYHAWVGAHAPEGGRAAGGSV